MVEIWLKMFDRLPPRAVAATIIPTAMRAAIRPYSIAVAPDSSFAKFATMFMNCS